MYWTPLLLLFGLLIGGSHSPGQVSSIGSGVLCTHPANGSKPEHMFIRSLDVGVVHWGSSGGASGHDMLAAGEGLDGQPWTQSYADTSTGAHFVLWDNLWDTNYCYWWRASLHSALSLCVCARACACSTRWWLPESERLAAWLR